MAATLASDVQNTALSQQLLLSLAEQLKVPLLQIARQAELASMQPTKHQPRTLSQIQSVSDMALRLIDNYVLGVQLATEHRHLLDIEPVSVSSVLYDAGHQLDAIAKSYGVTLELNISGRYGPVMAHREGLQAALVSLGCSLIEALPAAETPQLRLQLATHRCRYGIVAGLYSELSTLSTDMLRQGKRLQGRVRQPMVGAMHTSGAGVFVADTILQAMQSQLKVSRHHRLYGIGAILQPNNQMQLV